MDLSCSFSIGLNFFEVMDLTSEQLSKFLPFLSREEIIDWLQWNDPNGTYLDVLSMQEFDNILLKEEAMDIMMRQILEY